MSPRALGVAIVGGGPAGGASALALARRGIACAVIEQGARDVAGECLFPGAAPLLAAIGLADPAAEGHRASPGTQVAWGGRLETRDFMAHPAGTGWNLDRARFAAGLRARALAAGAGWIDGRLVAVAAGGPPFTLRIATAAGLRAFVAAAVLDASGRAAAFARRRGARRIVGARLVASHRAIPGRLDDPRLLVERVAGGWWYSAGLADRTVVSFQTDDPRRPLPGLGPRTCARLGALAPVTSATQPRRFVAGSMRLDSFAGPGWLAIGDAAMAHDPLSGHGIAAALAAGRDGAAAIAAWLAGDGGALAAHVQRRAAAWARYSDALPRAYAA